MSSSTLTDIVAALTLLRDKYQFRIALGADCRGLLAAAIAAFSCDLSTDIAGPKNLSLQLRVPVDGADPHIPTATGVYEVANWRERELLDMFGIEFEGHPDPRRIL